MTRGKAITAGRKTRGKVSPSRSRFESVVFSFYKKLATGPISRGLRSSHRVFVSAPLIFTFSRGVIVFPATEAKLCSFDLPRVLVVLGSSCRFTRRARFSWRAASGSRRTGVNGLRGTGRAIRRNGTPDVRDAAHRHTGTLRANRAVPDGFQLRSPL